jgi:hypothetical protein
MPRVSPISISNNFLRINEQKVTLDGESLFAEELSELDKEANRVTERPIIKKQQFEFDEILIPLEVSPPIKTFRQDEISAVKEEVISDERKHDILDKEKQTEAYPIVNDISALKSEPITTEVSETPKSDNEVKEDTDLQSTGEFQDEEITFDFPQLPLAEDVKVKEDSTNTLESTLKALPTPPPPSEEFSSADSIPLSPSEGPKTNIEVQKSEKSLEVISDAPLKSADIEIAPTPSPTSVNNATEQKMPLFEEITHTVENFIQELSQAPSPERGAFPTPPLLPGGGLTNIHTSPAVLLTSLQITSPSIGGGNLHSNSTERLNTPPLTGTMTFGNAKGAYQDGVNLKPPVGKMMRNYALLALKITESIKDSSKGIDTKQINVRLDPPSLGGVNVQLKLHDGVLSARLTPERNEAYLLLRDRGYEVERVLQSAGISADSINVSIENGNFTDSFNGGKGGSTFQESVRETLTPYREEATLPQSNSNEVSLDHWVA